MRILVLLLCLSGCAAIEKANLASFQKKCLNYGFMPGTTEMAQCMMMVEQAQNINTMNAVNALNASNMILQAQQPQTQNIKMNCMTSSFRGSGSIDCY